MEDRAFQDLTKDELLREWHAVKMQRQRRSFRINEPQWKRLNALIEKKNVGL